MTTEQMQAIKNSSLEERQAAFAGTIYENLYDAIKASLTEDHKSEKDIEYVIFNHFRVDWKRFKDVAKNLTYIQSRELGIHADDMYSDFEVIGKRLYISLVYNNIYDTWEYESANIFMQYPSPDSKKFIKAPLKNAFKKLFLTPSVSDIRFIEHVDTKRMSYYFQKSNTVMFFIGDTLCKICSECYVDFLIYNKTTGELIKTISRAYAHNFIYELLDYFKTDAELISALEDRHPSYKMMLDNKLLGVSGEEAGWTLMIHKGGDNNGTVKIPLQSLLLSDAVLEILENHITDI